MIQKTLFAITLMSVFGLAGAQQTNFYSDGRPEKLFYPVSGLDKKDMNFLKTAQAANEFEIRSSELAQTNSDSDYIKGFAKNMIEDHTAAKAEVAQVASQKSFGLNSVLPPALESKLNKLKSLHGAAFDKAYRAAQKQGHEQTISLLKSEIDHGHDQDVKAVAVKLLPTVELHLKLLQSNKTETGSDAATHGM